MSLTKDSTYQQVLSGFVGLPVKASTKITQGKMVGDDASGYARQLVAGDPFRGHSIEQADNSSGAAGDIQVPLLSGRYRLQVAVTGASAVTDVGSLVYGSDAETYTLTKSTNTLVGVVVKWVASTQCVVEFDTNAEALAKRTAAGVISIDDDVLLANGKAIKTDTTTAHTLEIQGYDVDGSTRPAMFRVTNGNAPTVCISNAPANGVSFFGAAAQTQLAHVADVATNLASDSTTSWQTMAVAVNGLFTALESFGFRATA
jgi:hypothetical protein